MKSTGNLTTYIKLVLTAGFWGGTFIAGRMLRDDIPPASTAFLRFAVASVFLLAMTLKIEKKLPPIRRRHIAPIIALGLIGISMYNVCFFKGLQMIEASRASLIVATCPIFITVFSAMLFGERLTPIRVAGIALSVLGAVVVIAKGDFSRILTTGLGLGELLIFVCVLCWTAYSLIGKPLMKDLSPLTLVTYSSVIGTAGLLIPACVQGLHRNITTYSPANWLAIVYLAVCGTVIGFTWFYQAVKHIGPTRAGLFINLVPIWAIVLAIIILHEPLTISLITGATLVITGVCLTNKKPKPHT